MALLYSQVARDDLREITRYTRETWGNAQATRYLRDLRAACRLASQNPFLGLNSDHFLPGLRRKVQDSHVIFYRIIPNGIRVDRILHHRMLPELHLTAEET